MTTPATAIWHMRSYFSAPGHEVSAREFARAFLRVRKQAAARSVAELGFVAVPLRALLDIELGDPDKPGKPSVVAYVSGGVWIAKCECGGAEFVDFDDPIFMCSTCWNDAIDHAWRTVDLPQHRKAIEAVLLARPEEKTRSWFADEKVADLVKQNDDHGAKRGIADTALAAVNIAEAGVLDGLD